ncbi:MAG: hypothetical protein EBU80_04120 [Chitinophagia bacterium]|jgi:hypothetical protein|nr:hypothetical protein [Chitinophagia bacterium]
MIKISSVKIQACFPVFVGLIICCAIYSCSNAQSERPAIQASVKSPATTSGSKSISSIPLDTAAYRKKMNAVLNGDSSEKWKFKGQFPLAGAILPFNRIIAYYGNLYSTRMGILGELPKPQMFAKLKGEIENWRKADPSTPVKPALHYIVTTAQGSPGSGGKYRLRMPNKEIDKVMAMAAEIDALVFLDIQVGLSNLREEIPVIEQYLKLPNVHLGIDPEFSMKGGQKPGTVIGTFDAGDINYTTQYLSDLVQKNNLPPKVLIIHRFTQNMVREYRSIKIRPEVQIVMDMDGWGAPARKINTYKQFVYGEPVQFTGFKLFYKNDLKEPPHRMLSPAELLKLKPVPLYIQYQ